MAIISGPQITSDSLILYFDAANEQSYTNGSIGWTDLINGKEALVFKGFPPQPLEYNSENKGSIIFDGIYGFIAFNEPIILNTNTGFTIDMWIYLKNPQLNESGWTYWYSSGSALQWGTDINNQGHFTFKDAEGTGDGITSEYIGNNWAHISFGCDATVPFMYLNGKPQSGANIGAFRNIDFIISYLCLNQDTSADLYSCYQSNIKIYNKVLSHSEVLQNFYANAGRYEKVSRPYFTGVYPEAKTSILLDKTGRAWGWGYSADGEAGINSTYSRCVPVRVYGEDKTFCKIGAGGYHTIALDNNGKAWGWGWNGYGFGQLGDNSTDNRCTPVSVAGATKTFCAVGSGYGHTIALDKNGKGWGWGWNGYGQLGDNSTTNQCTPVSIAGEAKTFCDISGGGYRHSLAIDKYGRAWSWGWNGYGQLGDNSTTDQLTPVSIAGTVKTFCAISAGGYHSLGIDKSGRAWSWGRNNNGQLGDNSITSQLTPVSVLGAIKTFCKIRVGSYHSVAIDKNGRAWSWGSNNYGQLGDNSITNQCTPVSVAGAIKTFCDISAGDYHSFALDIYGNVWGWGYNYHGQIGDNSTTNRCTPVRICDV